MYPRDEPSPGVVPIVRESPSSLTHDRAVRLPPAHRSFFLACGITELTMRAWVFRLHRNRSTPWPPPAAPTGKAI
jgi:hypothetical protein